MTFADIVARLLELIKATIPVLFALIVVVTLFGGTILTFNAGSEEKAKQGKQILFWGIIFLTVAVALWSIVFIIQTTFGLR